MQSHMKHVGLMVVSAALLVAAVGQFLESQEGDGAQQKGKIPPPTTDTSVGIKVEQAVSVELRGFGAERPPPSASPGQPAGDGLTVFEGGLRFDGLPLLPVEELSEVWRHKQNGWEAQVLGKMGVLAIDVMESGKTFVVVEGPELPDGTVPRIRCFAPLKQLEPLNTVPATEKVGLVVRGKFKDGFPLSSLQPCRVVTFNGTRVKQ